LLLSYWYFGQFLILAVRRGFLKMSLDIIQRPQI